MTAGTTDHVSTRTTTSTDGTSLAWTARGHGPAVVVVHGSIDTGTSWTPVADLLADTFHVSVLDRRGHGASDTSEQHSLDLEVADLLAVITAQNGPVAVVGHSFGAVVALHAALTAPPGAISDLVLYEPPLPITEPAAGPLLDRYHTLLAQGRDGDALAFGMQHIAHQPQAQVAMLRATPQWPALEALARSWEPELAALDALPRDADRFTALTQRTLLLLGTDSADVPFGVAVRALADVVPHATVEELTGQGHIAHWLAPMELAARIRSFLANR